MQAINPRTVPNKIQKSGLSNVLSRVLWNAVEEFIYIFVSKRLLVAGSDLSISDGLRVITQLKMDLLDVSESVYFMF